MSSLFKRLKKDILNMHKKGASYVFIGNFLTKFVAFFGSIFLIATLTKEEYGTFGYIENFFSYAYLLAGLGMTNALLRYAVLAENKNDQHRYYTYIIKKSTVFNIILVALACIIAYFYPHPQEFLKARLLLPLFLLSLPFHSLADSGCYFYRAIFDNKRFAVSSFLIVLFTVLAKESLAHKFGLTGAISALLIVYIAAAAVLLIDIKKRYFCSVKNTKPLSYEQKISVMRFSLQYMVTNGIWVLLMLNDVFMLGQLTGNTLTVASYKVAYVLPGNLSLISSSIGVLVTPYFIKKENDHEWVRKAYKKTYLITAGFVFIIVLFLFVFARPIITLMYGADYVDTVSIMRVLLVAAFINNGIRYTNANLLSSMGQIKYNMYVSLIGVIMQILLNLWMIPRFGVIGVAFTSVIVYSVMSVILLFAFYKKYFSKTHRIHS